MTRLEEIGAAELSPVEVVHANHLTQVTAGEREERLKSDGKVGNELKRDVEDRLHTLRIRLPYLPRLALRDILVTDAGEVHGLFLCLTEMETVEQLLYLVLDILELIDSFLVDIGQFTTLRHYPIPVFLRELQGTVDEVAVDSHKL